MQSVMPVLGLVAYAVTVLVLGAINLRYGGAIAAQKVPMQWDLKGDPTWYADKQIGLWFSVAVFLLVGTCLLYKARSAPVPSWTDYGSLWLCCLLMMGVHYWHVTKIVAWSQDRA